jgi:hypothetical protein
MHADPSLQGREELTGAGLTDEQGFIPVEMNTMHAKLSKNGNIYAVGDASATDAPKLGHIALTRSGWRPRTSLGASTEGASCRAIS